MEVTVEQKESRGFKIFLRWLYLFALVGYGYYLVLSLDYYWTPTDERVYHDQHLELRPAGEWGLRLGICGFVMLFAVLLYSLRKRTRIFNKWGTIQQWLDVHIFLGTMGPLLVLLHASFKASDLIAIGFWSMILVVITGVFGRYFYLLVPRTPQGEELNFNEIEEIEARDYALLQRKLDLERWRLVQLDDLINDRVNKEAGMVRSLISMALNDLLFPYRIYQLKTACAEELLITEPHIRRVVQFAWREIRLKHRILALNRTRQMLHYWLVLHKSFAAVLYLLVLIHVGVASYLGYI